MHGGFTEIRLREAVKRNLRAEPFQLRLLVNVNGGGYVFDGNADRFENCDLPLGGAALLFSGNNLTKFCINLVGRN